MTLARRTAQALIGLCAATWLAACAGTQHPAAAGPTSANPPPAVTDTRTPIEQRRDAACEQLGPKLTPCAVEDARADHAAGKTTQQQLDADTAPEIQRKNTEKFEQACKSTAYSSRQVRVLEVCFHAEARCAPLLECLGHLSDAPPAK